MLFSKTWIENTVVCTNTLVYLAFIIYGAVAAVARNAPILKIKSNVEDGRIVLWDTVPKDGTQTFDEFSMSSGHLWRTGDADIACTLCNTYYLQVQFSKSSMDGLWF